MIYTKKQIENFLKSIKTNNFNSDCVEIDIDNKLILNILEKVNNIDELSISNLFLNEGVINTKEFKNYIYFKKNSFNTIDFMVYDIDSPYMVILFTYVIDSNLKNEEKFQNMDCVIINNKKFYNINEKELNFVRNSMLFSSIAILSCINFIVTNQKTTIKKINKKKKIKSKHKKKVKTVKNIIISKDMLENTVYVNNNNNEKRDYERHTESWTRRGHYRHYKNGKTIWVPASTCKAKEKPKKDIHIKKNYIIK